MKNESIRVLIRPRPFHGDGADDQSMIEFESTNNKVNVIQHINTVKDHAADKKTSFSFSNVQSRDSTQQNMFDALGNMMVQKTIKGFNGTILAYGQTGAGKTFTLTGDKRKYEHRGLAPRMMDAFFAAKDMHHDEITIRFSALEIYNDKLIDLLSGYGVGDSASSTSSANKNLEIHESTSGMTVSGLKRPIVHTIGQALDCLFEAQMNRAISEHELNSASTRSHVIFTFYVESSVISEMGGASPVKGKLHLVDLAGSERIEKTKSTGDTACEAVHINKSLSFLEQVVVALGDKTRDHIPYRQTKLTYFLKDCLGGNCITTLIACVRSANIYVEESLATLKFASRMARIKTSAVVNVLHSGGKDTTESAALEAAQKEIALLRQELAMYDAVAGRDTNMYHSPLTNRQLASIDAMARQFLLARDKNEVTSSYPPVANIRQIYALFDAFRSIVLESVASKSTSPLQQSLPQPVLRDDDKLLCSDRSGSKKQNAVMKGPASSISLAGENISKVDTHAGGSGSGSGSGSSNGSVGGSSSGGSSGNKGRGDETYLFLSSMSKEEAFAYYKTIGEGLVFQEELVDGKQGLRELKHSASEAVKRVKSAKLKIDIALKGVEDSNGNDKEKLVELKAAKKAYRQVVGELNEMKSELDYLKRMVDTSRAQLVSSFNSWYTTNTTNEDISLPAAVQTTNNGSSDVSDAVSVASIVSRDDMTVLSIASSVTEEDSRASAYIRAGKRAVGQHTKGKRQKLKNAHRSGPRFAFGRKELVKNSKL